MAEICAASDSEASRRLCLDLWAAAVSLGEPEAVARGEVVLAGVREFEARRRALRGVSAAVPPGEVLGFRPPPAGGGYWWLRTDRLKTKVRPVMGYVGSGDSPPGGVELWSDGGGWWRCGGAR